MGVRVVQSGRNLKGSEQMKTMGQTSKRGVSNRGVGTIVRGLLAASLLVASAGLVASPMVLTAGAHAAARAELFKAGDKVKVTLKDGTVLEGEVVEHTQAQLRIRIKKDIGTSTRTLESSEIASMALSDGGSSNPAPGTPTAPSRPALGGTATGAATDRNSPFIAGSSMDPIGEETKTIYVIPFRGEFGRNVAIPPMAEIMADAKRLKPDIIVLDIDMEFINNGRETQPQLADPRVFFELEIVRQLMLLFTDEVRDDAAFVNRNGEKPRMVAWVRRALGAPAFLPWVIPEIYYAPGALHGGIGHVERISGSPSQRVREKMIGIMLATAEGLAIKGGHDPIVVRAMARTDYELSVDYVGGKPVFRNDMLGQEILTDAGGLIEERADTIDRVARYQGNDWLTLTSERALKLGVARGVAGAMDDLAFELGVARDFRVLNGRANQVLTDWSRELLRTERDIVERIRMLRQTQVNGETPEERNRQRGRIIGLCRDIIRMLDRYKDSLSPTAIGFDIAPLRQGLEVQIAEVEQAIRADRR